VLAALCGGEAIGDLAFARFERPDDRCPYVFLREPNEHDEGEELSNKGQIDIHSASPLLTETAVE
jgi:hypothetical protein